MTEVGKTEDRADFEWKAWSAVLDMLGVRFLLGIEGPCQVGVQSKDWRKG